MVKDSKEWALQAEYDLDVAKSMFEAGKHIYCVFMCHLSLEKMLKGLYRENLGDDPPKVHSLIYFAEVQRLKLSEETSNFLSDLDNLSVPTRYPEQLNKVLGEYSKNRSEKILRNTGEVIKCLKEKLKK